MDRVEAVDNPHTDELIADIVAEGELDYIDISVVGHLLILATGAGPAGLHARATEIAVELVRRGILVPGVFDTEFHTWVLSPDDAARRIHDEATRALEHSTLLGPGQICFFDITGRALRQYPPKDGD